MQKDEDNFLVTGWARTTLLLRCARDGEMFPQSIRAQVEHHFEAPHPATIDLTPFIREGHDNHTAWEKRFYGEAEALRNREAPSSPENSSAI